MFAFSFEAFAPRLNETFQVSLGTASVEMTLVDAKKARPQDINGVRKEPFTLLFKSASPVVLPQKMYGFANAAFGKADIFIVPVARDRDGIVYQAVFN